MEQNSDENRLKDQEHMLTLLGSLLEGVRRQLPAPSFSYWFSALSIEEVNTDHIVFGTDTKFKMEWLEERYSKMIIEMLKSISGTEYKLGFVVVPKKEYDA